MGVHKIVRQYSQKKTINNLKNGLLAFCLTQNTGSDELRSGQKKKIIPTQNNTKIQSFHLKSSKY